MDDRITLWLCSEGLTPKHLSSNHVRLYFRHSLAQFALDIIIDGEFVFLGAELMADIEGRRKSEFYRFIHSFNTTLNGPKVTLQDERFILVHERWYEDLSKDSLIRDIYWFRKVHEFALKALLEEAERLGLHFKKQDSS